MEHLRREQFAGSNFHYIKHTLDYFLSSMDLLEIPLIEFYMACPHFSPMDASWQDALRLRKKLARSGRKICCTTFEQCTYPVNIASEDPALRARSIETLKRVIEFSALLESPYTQVLGGRGSYDLPEQDAWKRAREAFQILAETGEKYGVCLVIEEASKHTTNTVCSTPLTRKMIDEVGSPYFRAMLDNCATETAGEDFRECVRLLGNDFRHMHFADGNPGGHWIPGEGNLPLSRYLTILDEFGYEGAVTFELYNKAYEMDPHFYMKHCFEWIEMLI